MNDIKQKQIELDMLTHNLFWSKYCGEKITEEFETSKKQFESWKNTPQKPQNKYVKNNSDYTVDYVIAVSALLILWISHIVFVNLLLR